MTGRRSPFRRNQNRFVLQERDRQILIALYQFRFLTNEQLLSLFGFGCLTRINVRLRKLFDNQYVCRRFLNNPCGQARILHFPGPEAVDIIARQFKIDSLAVRKRRRRILKQKDSSLNRYLLINKFRLALVLAFKTRPQTKCEHWRVQKEVPLKLEKNFYPDAYFNYSCRDENFNVFLEIDQPFKNKEQFQEKVEKYLRYGLEGYFERQFGFRFFRVLVITSSQARLKHLSKVIEGITNKMFWLTTWDMINQEKILTSIWLRPGREGLFSLPEAR